MMVFRVQDGRFLIFFFWFQKLNYFLDEKDRPHDQPEPELQAVVIAAGGEHVCQ